MEMEERYSSNSMEIFSSDLTEEVRQADLCVIG